MRFIFVLLLSYIFTFASEFYAVVQPIKTFNVKSAVSGQVTFVNIDREKQNINNKYILRIDDAIDKVDLQQSKSKLRNLEQILKLQKETLASYNKVKSKSKVEKDAQKITVLNTSSNISDLKVKIATLEDKIAKKNVVGNKIYLSEILVEVGDYVNPGTALYTAYDMSEGKLEIYIPISKIEDYKNKSIFLDGKKTDLKIDKLSKVADTKHISSYKAEIFLKNVKKFSKLVKIEFK
jgi:multidrug resistance efflux pump